MEVNASLIWHRSARSHLLVYAEINTLCRLEAAVLCPIKFYISLATCQMAFLLASNDH